MDDGGQRADFSEIGGNEAPVAHGDRRARLAGYRLPSRSSCTDRGARAVLVAGRDGARRTFRGDRFDGVADPPVARELDPLSPIANVDLSRALLFAGDVAGAIKQREEAVALSPRFERAHLFLAADLQARGRYADALGEIEAAMALAPGPPASDDLAFPGQMQWFAGDHAAARRELATVEARARQHYVSGVSLASLEWPVGKRDRAFANLQRAAADHDHLLMTVSGMRNEDWCADPRFRKLLASMHLPPR